MCNVRRCEGLNPGLTPYSRAMLSSKSAAPISNTIDSATCPITSAPRALTPRAIRLLPADAAASPLARNTEARSGRDAPSEGISPNNTPVPMEINTAKASTHPSSSNLPGAGQVQSRHVRDSEQGPFRQRYAEYSASDRQHDAFGE